MGKVIFITLILIAIALFAIWYLFAPEQVDGPEIPLTCQVDEDCVLFGETGDCNCGCYYKNDLPSDSGGECFCQAPTSCECINSKCEAVFEEMSFEKCVEQGNLIMESYPRQCQSNGQTFVEESCSSSESILTLADAKSIAEEKCGELKETYVCNETTETYWLDLNLEKEGCNPACVVNLSTREATINWRCTGLIIE